MTIFLKLIQGYLAKLSDDAIYDSRKRQDSLTNSVAQSLSSLWGVFASSTKGESAPVLGMNPTLTAEKQKIIKKLEKWIEEFSLEKAITKIAQAIENNEEHDLRFHLDNLTQEQYQEIQKNPDHELHSKIFTCEVETAEITKKTVYYSLKSTEDEILKRSIILGINEFASENTSISLKLKGSEGSTGELLNSATSFIEELYNYLNQLNANGISVLNMPFDETNPTSNFAYHAAWYLCDVLFDHFIMNDAKTSDTKLTTKKCGIVTENTNTLFGSIAPEEIFQQQFHNKIANQIKTTTKLIMNENKLEAQDNSTTLGFGFLTGSLLGVNLSIPSGVGRLDTIMTSAIEINENLLAQAKKRPPKVEDKHKASNPDEEDKTVTYESDQDGTLNQTDEVGSSLTL